MVLMLALAGEAHAGLWPFSRGQGSGNVAQSAEPVLERVCARVDRELRRLDLWARYELGWRPAARAAHWLAERANGLMGVLAPGGELEVGAVDGGVLGVMPVNGVESSSYGRRRDPISRRRRFHKGVDFKAPRGAPVYAAGAGVVEVARRKGSYGRLVIISHGLGLETRYAHLRRIKVRRGAFVDAGTLIGTVGATGRATGPHLHFEVRRSGKPVNPYRALGRTAPGIAAGARLVGDVVSRLARLTVQQR